LETTEAIAHLQQLHLLVAVVVVTETQVPILQVHRVVLEVVVEVLIPAHQLEVLEL
jgi:hypothetical protein